MGQLVAAVPSGLSLAPPQEIKKRTKLQRIWKEAIWPSRGTVTAFTWRD
jgi:hypothetical protein